jgi:hypothetical protein
VRQERRAPGKEKHKSEEAGTSRTTGQCTADGEEAGTSRKTRRDRAARTEEQELQPHSAEEQHRKKKEASDSSALS